MPTLNWIGKEKVVSHHNDVAFRVLDRKYTFGDTPNSGNMIIHGDNLEALKALLPKYEGRIDFIYIDPPYNTGMDNIDKKGWVYNDNVNDPHIRKWLGQVVGSEFDDLTRHDKWLCMMFPRLTLLQRLLSDDGAIFISIDDNEVASLKYICDEVFGKSNFVGQWQWYKSKTPPNLSYKIKKNVEYVLGYEKHKTSIKYRGLCKESKSDDPFTKPQNSYKVLEFREGSVHFKGVENGTIEPGIYGTEKFPNELLDTAIIVNGVNTNKIRFKNRFIWVQETLDENIDDGVRINCSKDLVLSYKRAAYDPEVPPNLIDSSVGVDTTEEAGKLLHQMFGKDVFDFPKHPSLIKYLISFFDRPNAIILDSFAGSGTTAHAVLELNHLDGGNRKYILCEMCDYADTITAERVKKVITGYSYKGESIDILYSQKLTVSNLKHVDRFLKEAQEVVDNESVNYSKVAIKIQSESLDVIGTTKFDGEKPGTGGSFDFYELGITIFDPKTGMLNNDADTEHIREYVWYSETHAAYTKPSANSNPYLLGHYDHNGYYFYYEKDEDTTLDKDFLRTITEKADRYIIYADRCLLTKDELERYNVVFKKIPRDIKRF